MVHRVAEEIVAYCTSCRMDLRHVICAIDGERIVRVLCKTCKKEHAYRRPKQVGALLTKKKAKGKTSTRKSRSAFAEWEKAMETCKDRPGKSYTLEGAFEEGDKVDHGTFGMGLVRKLIRPKKMEVLFEEGIKILVRSPSA